jgi:hypothetical protein
MKKPNNEGQHLAMPTRGGSSDDVRTNGGSQEHQAVNNTSSVSITETDIKVQKAIEDEWRNWPGNPS